MICPGTAWRSAADRIRTQPQGKGKRLVLQPRAALNDRRAYFNYGRDFIRTSPPCERDLLDSPGHIFFNDEMQAATPVRPL